MRVALMNFANGPRVVYNSENVGVEVPIGARRELDIAIPTANFIMKSMKLGDAGLVIVPGDTELPSHVTNALDLMRSIEHSAYDEMLARIQALIGREAIEPRPTRAQMRMALGKMITEFCERNMDELVHRAPIPPVEPRGDNMDGALAAALGQDDPTVKPQEAEKRDEDTGDIENDPPKKPNKRVAHPAKSKKQVANANKRVPKSKKKARVRL